MTQRPKQTWRESGTKAVLSQGEAPHLSRDLIGHVPDPERDRIALLRVADGGPALDELAAELHRDERWKLTPLAALLPRIEAFDVSGHPFPPLISARAANCLMRGRVAGWHTLAARTPAELSGLPQAGRITVEEILAGAVREWARFHLQDPSVASGPMEIYEGLLALTSWNASKQGTVDVVAAIAAAAESPETLPPPVARALRALRRFRAPEDELRQSLEQAFAELEASPGFEVFERRALGEGLRRPTQAELASELGVSGSRAGQMEAAVRRKLRRLMREPAWPIRLAAEQLREELGAVARLAELEKAFAGIDPGDSLGPTGSPHRRQLLLHLCDYRVDGEWVHGSDIKGLTDVILKAVANGEEPDLDRACRHLALLGVRQEVQLQWILSRVGFRIVDGRIVAVE